MVMRKQAPRSRRRNRTSKAVKRTSRGAGWTLKSRRSRATIGIKAQLTRKLKQARQAERRAIQQISVIIRKHQAQLVKMRRLIKQKVLEKTRAVLEARRRLAKQYQQRLAKLRRQNTIALAAVRRELSTTLKKKRWISARKRPKRSFSTVSRRRRTTARRKNVITSRKIVPFRPRRSSRAFRRTSLRRVA